MPQPGNLFGVVLLLCNVVIGGSFVRDLRPVQQVLQQPPDHTPPTVPERKLHGRFLHITDIHPDQFYQVHSSTDEDAACHRGDGPAGYYGAETSDCDTPFALVNATFDWIEKNYKDKIDFVIWTGDSARHDSDEELPRSSKQVLGTNRWIASKFTDLFYDEETKALSVPVIPTFGNNDILPHNIMMPGPNVWLQYYTEIWQPFIPEEQRHSFEFGGWFYVEVIPQKLAVFSLNTLYFFDRNAAIDDCINPSEPGYKQLEWLRVQLQFMRERGMKVILMGHVPPARTPSKMLWDESCWQKYTIWLEQYRDVVTASIYGHMNIDHFVLQDTREIDLKKLEAGDIDVGARLAMGDEVSVESASDYLMELRHHWSKIPKEAEQRLQELEDSEESEDNWLGSTKKKRKNKKKHKGKKKDRLGGRWAERYQLSLIGPSIVPNFFPSIRIVEYNITGLEEAPVWKGPALRTPSTRPRLDLKEEERLELRDIHALLKAEKNKKKKGEKAKKPKPPSFVIPEPPARTSIPGPAYSPQPLTLTGYTQYWANLTHINNDTLRRDGDHELDAERWRDGKHGGKTPGKSPDPHEFGFEVEYSTFKDKTLNLPDLTVASYVKLAYRMGKRQATAKELAAAEHDDDDDDDDDDDNDDDHGDEDEDEGHRDGEGFWEGREAEEEDGGGAASADKLRKHRKHKKHNKVWLHFLRHAFVSSVDKKDLEKLDY